MGDISRPASTGGSIKGLDVWGCGGVCFTHNFWIRFTTTTTTPVTADVLCEHRPVRCKDQYVPTLSSERESGVCLYVRGWVGGVWCVRRVQRGSGPWAQLVSERGCVG